MSPLPAASKRFIAYSGDVCRKKGRGRGSSANFTRAEWMCTSVTGAFTTIGVSTSRTPRSMKKFRADASKAARCSSIERFAVGCQSAICCHHSAAQPAERLANGNAVVRLDVGQPVDHVGCGYQDHGRDHIEAAHLLALFEMERRGRVVQR